MTKTLKNSIQMYFRFIMLKDYLSFAIQNKCFVEMTATKRIVKHANGTFFLKNVNVIISHVVSNENKFDDCTIRFNARVAFHWKNDKNNDWSMDRFSSVCASYNDNY